MSTPFGFLIPPAAPLVPPELQVQTISSNQLAYTIPAAAINSSIAVFLLPGQTLPAGSAAALYIQFPGQDFKFLGALGEGKASAVFRVAGLKGSSDHGSGTQPAAPEVDMDADDAQPAAAAGNVTIGISLEPAAEVQAKLAEQKMQQQQQQQQQAAASTSSALVRRTDTAQQGDGAKPSTKVLAQRIIQNAFNFLASFEGGNGMVPIKAFEAWWKKFEGRVTNDPGFLEREQD